METEHILAKGSGGTNEDTLVIEKNLFGVFDGATSLDKAFFGSKKTGGMIASSTACSIFSKNHYPLIELAKAANNSIHDKMISHGVNLSARECLWSTSAAVVRIKEKGLEWIQTGDSFIILIYRDHSYKVLAERTDHDFETLSIWKKMSDKSSSLIHEALEEQIRKTRYRMNRSYGVLNGEKEAETFLKSGVESLENVKEILVFTDGLNIPVETPEREKNFDILVERFLCLGLNGLKEHIREIEKNDPGCIKYPRFKCHDDIAAICIRLDI
ncbi:MAG: protein phosphatase 2C domain-containing protein [Desulfobacterium sp.]|nr:protein phosphatase 2C domain-containing protein [Desulfobacterium sp.]MBU3946642.1 protein phosphatase 2C domain-containing protein [Pseudomonadota bacterium]MBU4037375.1 protein phosphatase 2C domain-containing protein [Pseudomonadota bacterium]